MVVPQPADASSFAFAELRVFAVSAEVVAGRACPRHVG
jgi:hypothetical protein